MRDTDLVEFAALSPHSERTALAAYLSDRHGWRDDLIAICIDDDPVGIGAFVEARPNVISLLFLATDRFPLVALNLTRFITQRMLPRLKRAGVHRIEAMSIEGYDAAHRWIRTLGLEREGSHPGYGKGGETFHSFAWVRDDLRPTGP